MRGILLYLVVGLFLLISESLSQVKIKCYNCIAPLNTEDMTRYCNSSLYCEGEYCTKGPDAKSNGIYHGCSDTPPLDKAGTDCKWVTKKTGMFNNCYCKNIDYCNSSNPSTLHNSIIVTALGAQSIHTSANQQCPSTVWRLSVLLL
ncbi:unnamed protein product [Caenorhabditis bovis]|uniref:UPAR/Ly6 domain-containing protein n=1 Tax=Caenorhabditis bovis TaxID=2654633 RepID=A0A8S1F8Z4_9PELO|nr:unnamed protein product [Caenorhabditis bovis]